VQILRAARRLVSHESRKAHAGGRQDHEAHRCGASTRLEAARFPLLDLSTSRRLEEAAMKPFDIMQVKLTVIKAACGLKAEDDATFLLRLEEIYLRGYKHGIDDMVERVKVVVRGDSIT
jgi:hypothetical protein